MEIDVIKKLDSFGLTMSEAKVYVAILKIGKTTVSAVAKETGLNRRNIYDVLSTLLDKGLVFEIVGEKEGQYASVAPNKLLEMVQTKETVLSRVMPELKRKHEKEGGRERALIYKGVDGFKQYLSDVLEMGEDVHCIGSKGGWGYERLGDFAQWFKEERERRGIKVYNIYDVELKEIIEREERECGQMPLYGAYGEYRYSRPQFSTNSAVDIFGDHVVTFTGLYTERFDGDVTLFVLISRELADAWRVWFRFVWDRALK